MYFLGMILILTKESSCGRFHARLISVSQKLQTPSTKWIC